MSDDALYDMVIEWDQRRKRGEVLSAAALCRDNPDLVEDLESRIESIKATDWLLDTDSGDDEFLSLPDFGTMAIEGDDTALPGTLLDFDEFVRAISDSGLFSADELRQLQDTDSGRDTRSLAEDLVAQKKLTKYQAAVLLKKSGEPLLLDRYEVLEKIDRGGMGIVFKARHRSMDRLVALKSLRPIAVDSQAKVQRFKKEVRAAAKLSHANIVAAHDAHEADGIHFLVMEYVSGKDLHKLVSKSGPLPVADAFDHIRQAAMGLAHAHEAGIVHRDIKPSNLMLDKRGTVKVLDLGLASISSTDDPDSASGEELTETGTVMGTMAYMAPEQGLDSRQADHRSDIYSLGCTLFYLLTGQPPYREETPIKTLLAHREQAIPALSQQRQELPQNLIDIFERMVAKRPEDRFQSMTEVIASLDTCLPRIESQRPRVAAPASTVHYKPATVDASQRSRQIPRWSKSRWLATAAACLLLVLGGWYLQAIVFNIPTEQGTLVVEVDDPKNVTVFIDNQQVKVKLGKDGKTVLIGVKPGTHTLRVTSGGVTLATDASGGKVSISSGGRDVIKAWLQRKESLVSPPGGDSDLIRKFANGHTGPVSAVRFSPDGRYAVSVGADRTIRLWDTATGQEIRQLGDGSQNPISLEFSPDGDLVAEGTGTGRVRLWNVKTGLLKGTFGGRFGIVISLKFLSDGTYIVAGYQDSAVRLWNVKTGEELLLDGHTDAVMGVAVSSDDRSIVSGSKDETVRVWNVESRKQVRNFDVDSQIRCLALSPNDRWVAIGSYGGSLMLWDVRTGQNMRAFRGHTDQVRSVSFSRDGCYLLSGSYDKTFRLWEVATGRQVREFRGDRHYTHQVAFSPDGRFALSAGGAYKEGEQYKSDGDYALRLWRLPHADEPPRTPLPDGPPGEVKQLAGHTASVASVAFSPDGQHLLSVGHDGTNLLWSVEDGSEIRRYDAPVQAKLFYKSILAFAPDGQSFVACNGNRLTQRKH